jgi:uncharacterized Zn finger protein
MPRRGRSDWGGERFWEHFSSGPRRPANGIKAQTQRGQFGKTWWAGRWIAALERLVDAARLARGRSYARSGQVLTLDVSPEGVAAKVQGSRPTPYQVSIHFKRLSDAEWDKVADAMAAEAIYAAKLLSGEMPAEIEEVFKAAGTSLFPTVRNDLETDCSCPDWANPCKHVAAVHYLLGERFDTDPFLIFALRGRTQAEIAEALRARRAGGATVEAEEAPPAEAAEEPVPPLAESLDTYWSSAASLADLRLAFEAPPLDALAVKRLGPPPFWQDPDDFETRMEEMYQAIGAHAYRVAMDEPPP